MNTLAEITVKFDIPLVKEFGKVDDIQKFVEETRTVENAEGFILRFEDGHCVKVKGEWYCSLHKAMSALAHEKDVWQLVLNENSDDLKPFLQEADRDRLDKFEAEFWVRFNAIVEDLEFRVSEAIKEIEHSLAGQEQVFEADQLASVKKKSFALSYADSFRDLRGLSFQIYDGRDARESLRAYVAANIGTSTKVERIRELFSGLRWDEVEIDE